LLYWGWKFSMVIYNFVATKLLFPTRELMNLFDLPERKIGILAPGAVIFDHVSLPVLSCKIGYVGETSDQAGFTLMLEAFNKVRENIPDVELVIVAREKEKLKTDKEYVEWKKADFKSLGEALAQCSVCLIPRPIKGYNKLTLPIKFFDYLALGKAVVTTNLPAVARIVESEGVGFVSQDNADDIADKIITLLKNKGRLKTAQENAVKAIREKHSWRNRAENLHGLFLSYE